MFANFGVPKVIYSDGSPINSFEIRSFSNQYKIDWRISSPLYPKSNGLAEKAVHISKDMLKKADCLKIDLLDLLLEYRATPLPSLGRSPAEIPIHNKCLKPINELNQFHNRIREKLLAHRDKYKKNHDKTAREPVYFKEDDNVLLYHNDKWTPDKIKGKDKFPRSYHVLTQKGAVYRRNSQFLRNTSIEFEGPCDKSESLRNNDYDEILDYKHKKNCVNVNNNSLNLSDTQNSEILEHSDDFSVSQHSQTIVPRGAQSVVPSELPNTSSSITNLVTNVPDNESDNSFISCESSESHTEHNITLDHSYSLPEEQTSAPEIPKSSFGRTLRPPKRYLDCD